MTEDEKAWGQEFVAKATQGKSVKGCIVLHFGSELTGKRWPGASARSILSSAVDRGYHCFLFDLADTIGEWPYGGVTNIGKLGVSQVLSVISASDILLCVENQIFKAGVHFKKKVIPLFGFVPSRDISTNLVYKKDVVQNAEDIFSTIDNWVETVARSSPGDILYEISTFEI